MAAYKPEYSQHNELYRRKKYRRVALDYDREYYDSVLKPIADKHNLPVGSWIKMVVAEYLENEKDRPE